MMSSSVFLLRKSTDASSGAVQFSLWMDTMKDMENQLDVGKVKVDGKTTLEQVKASKGEGKKKLCLCAPTNHPGSFRCRHHRAIEAEKVKMAQDPAAAVAKHLLKLGSKSAATMVTGVKPQPSRFSKASVAATVSELSR